MRQMKPTEGINEGQMTPGSRFRTKTNEVAKPSCDSLPNSLW